MEKYEKGDTNTQINTICVLVGILINKKKFNSYFFNFIFIKRIFKKINLIILNNIKVYIFQSFWRHLCQIDVKHKC